MKTLILEYNPVNQGESGFYVQSKIMGPLKSKLDTEGLEIKASRGSLLIGTVSVKIKPKP